jgi:hypothetical protein
MAEANYEINRIIFEHFGMFTCTIGFGRQLFDHVAESVFKKTGVGAQRLDFPKLPARPRKTDTILTCCYYASGC